MNTEEGVGPIDYRVTSDMTLNQLRQMVDQFRNENNYANFWWIQKK